MTAIYDEVVLRWEGEDYTVQPSYRMIQAIESQGISIVGISNRLLQGEPPMSQIAAVISHMLRSGGADAQAEDVYAHMMSEAGDDEIAEMCEAIITAFTPRKKDQRGKEPAPQKGGKKKASKK